MVVTKDRAALSAALDRFASLVTTEEILADLRFDDRAFARVVGQLLSPNRSAPESNSRARIRLFMGAMKKLADRQAVQQLRDHLVRAMAAASLSSLDREAIAAALVCLDPVLAEPKLPASESPTLEIVFNHQFEGWARRERTVPHPEASS